MSERRILIAINGSPHSEKAFEWYCENVHHEGDVLVLAHSLELPPKPPTPFPYAEEPFVEWKKQIECIRDDSRNMLTNFQLRCEERNIEILNAVQDERYTPGPSLCKIAKENQASLIVLGSRGLSKMHRTFLGSVSDYVVHNSHLPVCVVRHDDQSKSPRSKDKLQKQHTAPASSSISPSLSSLSTSPSHTASSDGTPLDDATENNVNNTEESC